MTQEAAWIQELRSTAVRTGQRKAGKTIGYSAAAVNQVLAGKYPGDLSAVQRAVEEHLMHRTVECPVLGQIAYSACLEHQASRARTTNPDRVKLAKTCPRCPNRRTS